MWHLVLWLLVCCVAGMVSILIYAIHAAYGCINDGLDNVDMRESDDDANN